MALRVALVIAHETGHRIGAISQLRWSDVDMEHETIRWRGEHEKTGYEHRTPVTAEVLQVLEEARVRVALPEAEVRLRPH
ncbi:MAG: tyrosine-type recombinase/integrase [Gemmatimonadales bacterium]|nr:tyrosine-type recombinase/integrase [Gemmatimonadales bacterium]